MKASIVKLNTDNTDNLLSNKLIIGKHKIIKKEPEKKSFNYFLIVFTTIIINQLLGMFLLFHGTSYSLEIYYSIIGVIVVNGLIALFTLYKKEIK